MDADEGHARQLGPFNELQGFSAKSPVSCSLYPTMSFFTLSLGKEEKKEAQDGGAAVDCRLGQPTLSAGSETSFQNNCAEYYSRHATKRVFAH